MTKPFAIAAALVAALFAVSLSAVPAQAITKEEAQARCKAKFGGPGSRLARERAGGGNVQTCVKQLMQQNKKK